MEVVIIGAGAVGLSSAYYLAKGGARVRLVTNESEGNHDAASYGNAGMIVPSHFTPLAAPGVIGDGLKWMFKKKSPFSIKASADPALLKWLWAFNRSSTQNKVDQASPLLLEMNLASRDSFKELQDELDDFGLYQNGLMMHYLSAKVQEEEESLAMKAMSAGLDVSILDHLQIKEHEKDLGAKSIGAVLYKSDAHLNPVKFMMAMKKALLEMGVEIIYEQEIQKIETVNKKIVSIGSSTQEFKADEFLICAGAWSAVLSKQLKHSILLQAGKGYHMHLNAVSKNLRTPSILCEARVAMTPMGEDLRISGGMEIGGLNSEINNYKVEAIKEGVSQFFEHVNPVDLNSTEIWTGLRPLSADGLPYLGRAEGYWNLSYNTGHAMMGLSLAPISGKLIAELLLHARTDIDISLLDPNRFARLKG